jgi:hypothetical protein
MKTTIQEKDGNLVAIFEGRLDTAAAVKTEQDLKPLYDCTGHDIVFDCTKLKRAVPGFQAVTRFDEGVRRSVAYVLSHPELQVEEPEFDAWCDRVIEAQEKAKACFQPT